MTSTPGKARAISKLLNDVRDVLAALAGTAALVYASGGLVIAVRMFVHGLPPSVVVGQLPRDWLVSIGFGEVVLPALAVAALYGIARLVRGTGLHPSTFTRIDEATAGENVRWFALLALGTLLLATIPIVVMVGRSHLGPVRTLLLAGAAVAIAGLSTFAALNARARIARRYNTASKYNHPTALLTMVVVVACWAVPSAIMAQAAAPLLDAQVCTKGGIHYKGWFLGESGSSVYIGENVYPHRVVAVAHDEIAATFTGHRATAVGCRRPVGVSKG